MKKVLCIMKMYYISFHDIKMAPKFILMLDLDVTVISSILCVYCILVSVVYQNLGPAPRWCTMLDGMTEELEEKEDDSGRRHRL